MVERTGLDESVSYLHFLKALFLPSYWEMHILVSFFHGAIERQHFLMDSGIWSSPLVFFPFHFQAAFKNMDKSFLCTCFSMCKTVVLSSPKDVVSLQSFLLSRLVLVLPKYISRLIIVGFSAIASRLHLSILSGAAPNKIQKDPTVSEAYSLRECYLPGAADGKMMKYLLI